MTDTPKYADLILKVPNKHGKLIKTPVRIKVTQNRIEFVRSPFHMKDEIKAMKGAKWHGFEDPPRKIWSVENCQRNLLQLNYLRGENIYAWFDRPIVKHEYTRPLYTHQKHMADHCLTYHYAILAAEMGTGKGQTPNAKIMTPTGYTTFGEVKVGDEVINPDGGVTKVKGVFPRGKMEMFKVTFSDGSTVVTSADHLWNVQSTNHKFRGQGFKTLELQEIVASGLRIKNGNSKWYIPMVKPVEFAERELPVDPYVVGYLLGNGCCSKDTCSVSAPDEETVGRLQENIDGVLRYKKRSDKVSIDYDIIAAPRLRQWLKDVGLKGCKADTKFIPHDYLYNSVENRIALLQGLCDSDGYAGKTGIEYCTISRELCDGFVELVQSLGGTCHVAEKIPTFTYKGEKKQGQLAYRIHASFSSEIQPFRLSRKADAYTIPTKYQPTRAIVSVESIGEEECICISVEAENQLYVTDGYIVTHNTLSAIEVMEKSGVKHWYWVGPRSGLNAVEREFKKWSLDPNIEVKTYTYEGLNKKIKNWGDSTLPQGVIFDESSRVKSPKAQRSQAAQKLADGIREKFKYDGYTILMSGTPSPKSPCDWWSPCEICWPGFLKEGTYTAFERRLGIFELKESPQGKFYSREAWLDDENKCAVCGQYKDEHDDSDHKFKKSKNEVALLSERLKGLTIVKRKKDCLDLPAKRYRTVHCEVDAKTSRVAKALLKAAPNTITGMTWLRELSDGFMYQERVEGTRKCPVCEGSGESYVWIDPERPDRVFEMLDLVDPEEVPKLEKTLRQCPTCKGKGEIPKKVRFAREVASPKDAALTSLLEENDEQGRVVIFAGFTGSIEKITKLCLANGWDVAQVSGAGWKSFSCADKKQLDMQALDLWASDAPKVAFVAHPASGGMAVTLTEARMAIFYSNDFNPESRSQAEDRIHRISMDENLGATIVDIINLPTDERVIEVLKENRKLELMTLGEVEDALKES